LKFHITPASLCNTDSHTLQTKVPGMAGIVPANHSFNHAPTCHSINCGTTNLMTDKHHSQDIYMDIKTINITYDAIDSEWTRMTPPAIKNKIDEIYAYLKTDPSRAIKNLLKIKKQYGDIPIVNNYLFISYMSAGYLENAEKIAKRNYKLFPRYLFAKINYANICLIKEDMREVQKILEWQPDLTALYPERKQFHITEFLSFMGIWALYHNLIGERKIAKSYYKAMKTVDSKHPITRNVKQKLRQPLMLTILQKLLGEERIQKFQKELAQK